MAVPEQIDGVTRRVVGMDLHPVAVTFARVTYLAAIGRDRLTHPNRRTIQISATQSSGLCRYRYR
jgi:hypothetical protein